MHRKMTTKRSSNKSSAKDPLPAWSFSRLKTYRACPAKLSFEVHDRIKEPANAAMNRGRRIHELAEQYVGGTLRRLPRELAQFSNEFKALRKLGSICVTEDKWCFTEDFGDSTEYFADDAWCRLVIDAWHLVMPDGKRSGVSGGVKAIRVIDYKTGKPRPEQDQEQLDLYALAAFTKFEGVEEIHSELWYLDHGEITSAVYDRSCHNELVEHFSNETAKMLADTRFAPTPGGHCKWCFHSKTKGGRCRAG